MAEEKKEKIELLLQETKEDLKDLEKFIEEFSAFLPLPVCTVNPLGIIVDINQAFCDLTGYTKEEIIGEEVNLLFLDKKEFKALEKRIFKEKLIKAKEIILLSKAKEKIPVSISASTRENGEGNLIGYFLAFFDISELKEYQGELEERVKEKTKELTREYNLLQTLIDNIPDSIYFKDEKNRFIRVNKAKAEHSSTTSEEMIGKTDFDFFSKERAEESFADDNRVIESNKPLINKIEKVTLSNGTVRWISVTKMPRCNEEGKVIGTMGISRDITETKKLMENLKETKLALKLKEAEERLMRSEKLAAIGQLAAGVVHELRNPLWALKNAIYYLNKKVGKSKLAAEDPHIAQFLQIADKEIDSSNRIIGDLLGFARIPKPAFERAQINEVIEDALTLVELPPNIKIIKELDPELPLLSVDKGQMRGVFSNIVRNAFESMPKEGKLRIKSKRKEKSIQVEFTDTGRGIPKEVLGKIFDPLFTGKAKGVGLGLAICEQIIEAHKGEIKVKSEEGKGATFTIILPIGSG